MGERGSTFWPTIVVVAEGAGSSKHELALMLVTSQSDRKTQTRHMAEAREIPHATKYSWYLQTVVPSLHYCSTFKL